MFYRYEVLEKDGKVEFSQEEMEDSEEDYEEDEDAHYCPSSTAGDYGPGNPWDAPGMSIKDFIIKRRILVTSVMRGMRLSSF